LTDIGICVRNIVINWCPTPPFPFPLHSGGGTRFSKQLAPPGRVGLRKRRPDDLTRKGGIRQVTRGRVDWYSAIIGYGFIIPDDGSTKVLVRRTEIEGSDPLENGDKVVYEMIQGGEGMETRRVSKHGS
jgi:cold shock CspA family protein